MANSFIYFSQLPPELREQIWREALPPDVRPQIFQMKQGYWRFRRGGPQIYGRESIVCFWNHSLVQNFAIKAPLAIVNREANSVMRRWVARQDFSLPWRVSHDRKQSIYYRNFDPERDAVFVWPRAIHAARPPHPHLLRLGMSGLPNWYTSHVTSVAIPEHFLRRSRPDTVLSYTFGAFEPGKIRTLYIVQSESPNEIYRSNWDSRMEIKDSQEGSYHKAAILEPKGPGRMGHGGGWSYVPGSLPHKPRLHALIERLMEVEAQGRGDYRAFELKIVPVIVAVERGRKSRCPQT